MTYPSTAWVTGLTPLLCSVGVPGPPVRSAFLIRLSADGVRRGERPFALSSRVAADMCAALSVEYQPIDNVLSVNEPFLGEIYREDVVDIQIPMRIASKRLSRQRRLLAAQHELASLLRPSLLGPPTLARRKRADLLVKLALKKGIRSGYTMSATESRRLRRFGFRERSLDWGAIGKATKTVANSLELHDSYSFLKTVRDMPSSLEAPACVVNPIPDSWEGTQRLNRQILQLAEQGLNDGRYSAVIVKNHPSDPTDYRSLAGAQLARSNSAIFLNAPLERTLPVEITVQLVEHFGFLGGLSTASMMLRRQVSFPSIVVERQGAEWRKHHDYLRAGLREVYPFDVLRIPG